MRVMVVTEGLWNGGAERQLALLASSLPDGWRCLVASLQDGPYRRVLEEAGVEVAVFPRRFRLDVTPTLRLWRAARRMRPDIVHAWGWMSALALLPYCRIARIPLINGSIRHGSLPVRRPWIDGLAVRLSDVAVANSRAGLRAYDAEGPRGRVIYNGFDTSRLTGSPAAPRGEDRTCAVMTARMCPDKDWKAFVGAARILASEDDAWHFVGIGDGPDRSTITGAASDLVRSGRMEFPEPGMEVLPTVSRCDIGVLLTDSDRAEGCSNSVLEYMACGLPVVCSDAGGNSETVRHGVTGLLVPQGDVDAIVSSLRGLRADPVTARAMGEAGRLRIAERFSTERMVADYVSLYESLRPVRA